MGRHCIDGQGGAIKRSQRGPEGFPLIKSNEEKAELSQVIQIFSRRSQYFKSLDSVASQQNRIIHSVLFNTEAEKLRSRGDVTGSSWARVGGVAIQSSALRAPGQERT